MPISLPVGWTQPSTWLGYPTVASTPQLIISSNSFGLLIGYLPGTYPAAIQAINYSTVSNTTPNGSPISSLIIQCSLVSNDITMPSNIMVHN